MRVKVQVVQHGLRPATGKQPGGALAAVLLQAVWYECRGTIEQLELSQLIHRSCVPAGKHFAYQE